MELHFTHDAYIGAAVTAVAVVFLVSLLSIWRRWKVVNSFSRVHRGTLYGTGRLMIYAILFTGIATIVSALLLRPYILTKEQFTIYEPMDIVINMDISYSMLAQASPDPCGPSRLQMSQDQVYRFLDYIEQRNVDRSALVLFSRFGYRLVPVLTRDYGLIRQVLGDFTHREIAMGGLLSGTNHWDALIESLKIFEDDATGKRLIIVITDGETDGPEEILVKSREVARNQISELQREIEIHIIGIGDPVSQYLIPLKRDSRGCPTGYMVQLEGQDEGALIKTQMDQSWLRALSGQLDATYHHAFTGDELTDALTGIVSAERIPIGTDVTYGKRDISRELLWLLLGLLTTIVIVKTP